MNNDAFKITLNQSNVEIENTLTNKNNLLASGTKNTYVYQFPTQLIVNNDTSQLGFSDIAIYNSFLINIRASLNNNTFQIYYPSLTFTVLKTITYPDGFYTIQDMINHFYNQLIEQDLYLIDNYNNRVFFFNMRYDETNLKFYLLSNRCPNSLPSGWQQPPNYPPYRSLPGEASGSWRQPPGTSFFREFFGITATVFPNNIGFDTNNTVVQAPFSRATTINSFIITASIVSNNTTIANPANVIYTKAVDPTTFGELLTDMQNEIVYMKITRGIYNKIVFKFFDNFYRPLDILDSNLYFSVNLKII
jgi:hypothetical protein